MPGKLDQCVKSVIASGKSEAEAHTICTVQFQDTYHGAFQDAAVFDPENKTAVSVRDGVIEYLGVEIGMEPADKMFTVYRSPATIANTAMSMEGLPITDEHVDLDLPAPGDGGFVSESAMIDASDPITHTTIAIRNKLSLSDTMRSMVEAGKRELSLGYHADLVPHDEYDFEQRDIIPHHLATVDRGRCGSMCSFIDRKPTTINEDEPMKLHKAFSDADGAMNLQQIVELATALPEAIKAVPVDQLQKLLPALQQIVEAAKGVMPAEEPAAPVEGGDEETIKLGGEPDAPAKDAEPAAETEEEKEKFSDAVAAAANEQTAGFVDKAVKEHAAVIGKARDFVDEQYDFSDKSTVQIMRDAAATQTSDKFTDTELPLVFKLLKKPDANYTKFGDTQSKDFDSLKDKEL